MVPLQLGFCSPPYDYVSLLCNVSGLLREGQHELSVCRFFWIEARPRHPPPHPPPPLSPARSPRVKPEFFLSYLAELSLLLGNLHLHLRIKIPGKFSQTRPQASFARLFFQAVSHERHLTVVVCWTCGPRPYHTSVTLFLAKLSWVAQRLRRRARKFEAPWFVSVSHCSAPLLSRALWSLGDDIIGVLVH